MHDIFGMIEREEWDGVNIFIFGFVFNNYYQQI